MTDQPDPKKMPFRPIQTYLKEAFTIHERALTISKSVRALIRWFFELLRNLVVVSGILFLSIKTQSKFLEYIALAGLFLLAAYTWTYLDVWIVRPFHGLKNQRLGMWLDIILFLIVVVGLSILSDFALGSLVFKISESYIK